MLSGHNSSAHPKGWQRNLAVAKWTAAKRPDNGKDIYCPYRRESRKRRSWMFVLGETRKQEATRGTEEGNPTEQKGCVHFPLLTSFLRRGEIQFSQKHLRQPGLLLAQRLPHSTFAFQHLVKSHQPLCHISSWYRPGIHYPRTLPTPCSHTSVLAHHPPSLRFSSLPCSRRCCQFLKRENSEIYVGFVLFFFFKQNNTGARTPVLTKPSGGSWRCLFWMMRSQFQKSQRKNKQT